MSRLDRLHAWTVRQPILQRLTAATRLLLAVGFLPPGLKKVLGEHFTTLPTSDPVGAFFDVFFQAHAFYVFVGVAQVAAALMLLWPRTATLGAVLYAPIIANITAITWSIGFEGTRWVTAGMALGVVYLLCWDYDRLKTLLPTRRTTGTRQSGRSLAAETAAWSGAGVLAGLAAIALHLGNVHERAVAVVTVLAVLGAAFGLATAWHVRGLPAPEPES